MGPQAGLVSLWLQSSLMSLQLNLVLHQCGAQVGSSSAAVCPHAAPVLAARCVPTSTHHMGAIPINQTPVTKEQSLALCDNPPNQGGRLGLDSGRFSSTAQQFQS